MILANGIPKSGTHYLALCLELMGFPKVYEPQSGPCCLMDHWVVGAKLPEHEHHILIIRHPKNALISYQRRNGGAFIPGALMSSIRFYPLGGKGCNIGEFYQQYFGWLDDPNCLIVRYEEMLSDGGVTIGKIARLTDGIVGGVYETAPGIHTATWTGIPSNWRDHWTPAVEEVWKENGGEEAERTLGYG